MKPIVISESAVIAAVMAKHPGLTDARLRFDRDDMVYFLAQRSSGMSVCIAVYRSLVIWSTEGVTAAILSELAKP